jgi:hypothetical protein
MVWKFLSATTEAKMFWRRHDRGGAANLVLQLAAFESTHSSHRDRSGPSFAPERGKSLIETPLERKMRTYGKQTLRGVGAILFLGMFGSVAALIPVALFALTSDGTPPHWTLYAGASIVGGAAIGWLLRR